VLATEEGGRRLCKEVRRRLGKPRKQKNANETSQRLRKSEEKVGKSLTVTKTRCGGGLLSRWISAMFLSLARAAARSRVGLGGLDEAKGAI